MRERHAEVRRIELIQAIDYDSRYAKMEVVRLRGLIDVMFRDMVEMRKELRAVKKFIIETHRRKSFIQKVKEFFLS